MKRVLITGHAGLVGRPLKSRLEEEGYSVRGFDVSDGSGNINDEKELKKALVGCQGVVHLAAVSRVVWGENDPDLCWRTNAIASESLIQLSQQSPLKPWVLVVSSREVYGEPEALPVLESAPVMPVNIYGRSKAYMEEKALEAQVTGLKTAVVRLSNVYGSINDHVDRVLPAFCRNAVEGRPLRVDGRNNMFDFTHISDTISGLMKVIEKLDRELAFKSPIHLLPGIGTTLGEAARLSVLAANSSSDIVEAPSRAYDVSRFYGNPQRTNELLDWEAVVTPERGISMLVKAFQKSLETKVKA